MDSKINLMKTEFSIVDISYYVDDQTLNFFLRSEDYEDLKSAGYLFCYISNGKIITSSFSKDTENEILKFIESESIPSERLIVLKSEESSYALFPMYINYFDLALYLVNKYEIYKLPENKYVQYIVFAED